MRRLIVLGMVVVCAAWSTTALGQYRDDNEGYNASPEGVDLNGQGDFYNPEPSNSISGKVVTYADNYLGLPANPAGGKNFIASEGPGGGRYSRSQRDMSFGNATGEWTAGVDIAVTFTGQGGSSDYVGSFSTQQFPGERTCIYPLCSWVNIGDPKQGWKVMAGWYPEGGGDYVLETIGDPGFQNLKIDHWYRAAMKFDLDSNQILEVSITDLETGDTATYEPPDRYLGGGKGGGGLPDPSGLRYFGGTSGTAGNTTAWDNLEITSEAGCIERTKQKRAKCRNEKVKAKIKRGKPGGRVIFVLKDDQGEVVAEQEGNVNNRGKSATTFRGIPAGDYSVHVCGSSRNVTCE